MKKVSILSIFLGLFCTITFSSEEYNEVGLMVAFRRYYSDDWDSVSNYFKFYNYLRQFAKQSPINCLKSLERYQNNHAFVIIFWHEFKMKKRIKEPADVTAIDYILTLKDMIREMERIFMGLSTYGSKFENDIEISSFLIRTVERNLPKLVHELTDKELEIMREKISIGKFLAKHTFTDSANKTVDYNSLFQTINELKTLIRTDELSEDSFKRQRKLLALLWFHLCKIQRLNCKAIFDLPHQNKALIIYLVLKMQDNCPLLESNEDFYLEMLEIYLNDLYKSGSLNLEPMDEFLKGLNPNTYAKYIKAPKKISKYNEVTHFSYCKYFKFNINQKWRVQGLSVLELYISKSK